MAYKNREKGLANRRKNARLYRQRHPERFRQTLRECYWKYRDRWIRRFKLRRDTLPDGYVCYLLRKQGKFSEPFPDWLIELKRRQIRLKRAIRNACAQTNQAG